MRGIQTLQCCPRFPKRSVTVLDPVVQRLKSQSEMALRSETKTERRLQTVPPSRTWTRWTLVHKLPYRRRSGDLVTMIKTEYPVLKWMVVMSQRPWIDLGHMLVLKATLSLLPDLRVLRGRAILVTVVILKQGQTAKAILMILVLSLGLLAFAVRCLHCQGPRGRRPHYCRGYCCERDRTVPLS